MSGVRPAMEYLVEFVVGGFAWAVANLAYLDFRRRGVRGFKRLVAFWMGTPTTFATLLLVRERSASAVAFPDEGLDALEEEIRRDRRLRTGSNAGGEGE